MTVPTTSSLSTDAPAIRYVHVLKFKAVHQLKDPRTGHPEQELHGHDYTVEMAFEDASADGLGLPERPTTAEAIDVVTEFVSRNLHNRDLSRMQFRTTPLVLAWYLFDRLAEHGPATQDLTDITLIVDGQDRYTYRPTS